MWSVYLEVNGKEEVCTKKFGWVLFFFYFLTCRSSPDMVSPLSWGKKFILVRLWNFFIGRQNWCDLLKVIVRLLWLLLASFHFTRFCMSIITSSGYIIKINTIWHVSNIPITNLTSRYTNLEFFCNYNFFSTVLLEIIQKRTGVNKAQDEIST